MLSPFELDPKRVPPVTKKFSCVFQKEKCYLWVYELSVSHVAYILLIGLVSCSSLHCCIGTFAISVWTDSYGWLNWLYDLIRNKLLTSEMSFSSRYDIPESRDEFFSRSARSRIVDFILRRTEYSDDENNLFTFGGISFHRLCIYLIKWQLSILN